MKFETQIRWENNQPFLKEVLAFVMSALMAVPQPEREEDARIYCYISQKDAKECDVKCSFSYVGETALKMEFKMIATPAGPRLVQMGMGSTLIHGEVLDQIRKLVQR